ncbi:MAG: phosphatidylglycerophosphatase A family protein [Stenotrophobium sp.]
MTPPEHEIPKAPAELILTTPEHLIAYGFGAGLAPKAPGTFGTLVGLPFWFLLSWLVPQPAYYLLACAVLFVFGCWVCGESARLLGLHDAPGIVFDEIVGFLLTCFPLLFLPANAPHWPWLIAAFLLFRLFDILKPWPIRWLDQRVGGGFGIMVDDALAAVAAAVCLFGLLQLLVNW